MTRIHRLLLLIVLVPLTVGFGATVANANSSMEAAFQDQDLLLNNPGQVDQTLQTLRLLGVQRLRVGIVWDRVAPAQNSRQKPSSFNATDPGAYPAANWAPYDTVVREAAKYGMTLNFEVGGGSPLWATRRAPSAALARSWYPSASEFGAFVQAVGKRYSGQYTPPGGVGRLPRVNYWSIWNEPNVGTSGLSPQVVKGVEVAPALYRGIANAAYRSLQSTGHGHDTILVGELASTGHANPGTSLGMQPLRFLRALFCVDSRYKPLRGSAASKRGCPTNVAGSRRFRGANPALFLATGWSHHPYHVGSTAPPNVPSPRQDPDWVTFADLPRLERGLDRILPVYGSHRRYSIYLTEYGYNTRPPQSQNAVSPTTQGAYLNQAEYMAWRDPRVRTLTQYTLQDSPQIANIYSAYAAGLIFSDGRHKPSFDAYRLPIWMPTTKASRGKSLTVWGCIRPAHFAIPDTAGPQTAQIQFQAGNSGQFLTFGTVTVRSANSCYFSVGAKFPGTGSVRLAYTYPANDPSLPAGTTVYSRTIRVTLR